MIKELTRRMNEAERSLLTEWVTDVQPFITFRDTVKWSIVWSGGLLCCGLLAACMFLFDLSPVGGAIVGAIVGGPLAIIGVICLYVLIRMWSGYIHWSAIHRSFIRNDLPELKQALLTGMVTVKKICAKAVIELEEFEDEGGGYIFDIGDGQVLFLKGQQYFPVNDEMPWPNTRFEIVRTNPGNRWVGIFCYGGELPPLRTIQTSECNEDVVWAEHEEIADGDLESFAKSLLAT
jgi:hypothetical protein